MYDTGTSILAQTKYRRERTITQNRKNPNNGTNPQVAVTTLNRSYPKLTIIHEQLWHSSNQIGPWGFGGGGGFWYGQAAGGGGWV